MAVRFEAPETRRRTASATRLYVPRAAAPAPEPEEIEAAEAFEGVAEDVPETETADETVFDEAEEVWETEDAAPVVDPDTGEIVIPAEKTKKSTKKADKAAKKAADQKAAKPKREKKPLFGKRTVAAAQADGDLTRPIPVRVKREMSTIERMGIMFCAFIFAGMIVFILSGYERISRAYADINTLNDGIDDVRVHISELNVQIECAVTIEQAQSAAERYGMKYPTKSQYLSAGSPIPDTAANTGDTPTGEDPTANPDGNGEDPGANTPDTPDGDTTTPEA